MGVESGDSCDIPLGWSTLFFYVEKEQQCTQGVGDEVEAGETL